jgi:hypothetical protein
MVCLREQKKLLLMPSAAVIHKSTKSCIIMSSSFLSLLLITSTSSSGSISINSLSIDTPILPVYNDNLPLSNYFLLQRSTAMEDYSGDDTEASADDTETEIRTKRKRICKMLEKITI